MMITEEQHENNGNSDGICTEQPTEKKVIGRPFPKGVSGNPNGRPKGKTLLTRIREIIYDGDEGAVMEKLAQSFIAKMSEGSFQHLKEFIDRENGKVPDRVANADGTNIQVDYSKLTTEELVVYRSLVLKARREVVDDDGERSGTDSA